MTGINPLETTLDRVGRILSQDYHIQVLCKGNECKTDGRTIWLPSLPEEVPESLWQLLRGEIDHEVAHILFTDFGGKMQAFGQKWGAFGHDLLNVIEDVRVNYALARKYPGAGENIQHSLEAICKEHTHRLGDMPFPVRFLCALFLAGMGMAYDRYGKDAICLVDQFSPETETFKSLRSTEEACDVAESILRRLPKNPPTGKHPAGQASGKQNPFPTQNQPPPGRPLGGAMVSSPGDYPNKGQSQQPSNPSTEGIRQDGSDNHSPSGKSASDSQNSGGPKETAEPNTPKESPPDPSSNPASSSNGENPTTQKEEKGSSGLLNTSYPSEGNPMDLARAVQQKIHHASTTGSDRFYQVFDPSSDRVKVPYPVDQGEAYRQHLADVRPQIGALRQQLLRTLQARDSRFWVHDREEGQISSRRLYTLLSETNTKVFRQKQDLETQSVAVTLLVDLSSSMSGMKIRLARQVTVLFAETLHQLRFASEVLGFSTSPSKPLRVLAQESGLTESEIADGYARYLPVEYTVFKAFREPLRRLKERIPDMETAWYTPLNEAVLFAAKRIIVRPESRKIILVLTDGEPSIGNPRFQQVTESNLQHNLERITQAGIECVAIGIQTDYVRNFFPDYVAVFDVADLPKAFYKKFSVLLRITR